ncbi:MAG TPA: hypothetical protein VH301_03205 [Usitatibacter sp.]|jgi:hypothetical protein|nr:hypothetical protein [Usitatibacter sp.]
MADEALFRKAALDRLASPERLDERLRLPAYPRGLLAALAALLAAVAGFAIWLLATR